MQLSSTHLGTVVTGDATVLRLVLSTRDANAIRSLMRLARSTADTFVAISSPAVSDMSGNAVAERLGTVASPALRAQQVDTDTTATHMTQFSINMGLGALGLTFAEPVIAASVNMSQLTFLDGANGAITHTLAGGVITSAAFSTSVDITLQPQDLDSLKRKSLCTTSASCFLAFGPRTITDTSNLYVQERSASNPVNVTQHIGDGISPALAANGFRLFDLNQSVIVLSFSEAVRVSTIDPRALTLENFYETPDTSFTLTNGTILTLADGPEITIRLTKADIDAIKTDRQLCISRSTCYVRLAASFLRDIAGNALTPTSPANTNLNAQRFVFDTTAPVLEGFALNMDARRITLTFSEPVSSKSFRAGSLTILNSGATKRVLLSGGSTASADGLVIVADLLTTDINEIKRLDFALTQNDTFLALASSTVEDMAVAANQVVAISTAAPLQASAYTPDSTKPRLNAFVLDLNAGLLTLDFSEPVRAASSLSLPKIGLQSANTSSAVSVTLTTATLAAGTVDGATKFTLSLSSRDIEAIKVRTQLATRLNNTFLTLQDLAIVDMAGNAAEVIAASSALGASSFIEDVSPTTLQAFTLSMNNATLVLTFSDVVVASSLKIQGITVQNAATASTSYTLKSSSTTSANGLVVLVDLSREDLLGLNSRPQIAKTRANTYLTVSGITIDDIYGRSMFPTIDGRGLQAGVFEADVTSPVITRFSFDLGAEELRLDFSEAVVPASFNVTHIVLQSASASAAQQQRLTNSTRVDFSVDQESVRIGITRQDMNALKLAETFAEDAYSLFLAANSNLVADFFANPSAAILTSSARQVDNFTADAVAPRLERFSLDMDRGVLSLSFTEVIRTSTFVASYFTVQSNGVSSLQSYALTGGNVTGRPNGAVLDVTLIKADIDSLKQNPSLVTSLQTTWISVAQGGVWDMANQTLTAILSTQALQASEFTSDLSRPSLDSFTLNLNTGVLSLRFSETVKASTVRPEEMRIQNKATIVGDVTAQSVVLSPAGVQVADNFLIAVQLSTSDLNALKALTMLATGTQDTFIVITTNSAKDMSGNNIFAIVDGSAKQASGFTADTTQPILLDFSINMNASRITLTFDETVNASSVVASALVLQSAANASQGGVVTLRLAGAVAQSASPSTEMTITLLDSDMNEIKRLGALCVSSASCYLSTVTVAALDMSANAARLIDTQTAKRAFGFEADTTSPTVLSFSLNMNTSTLTLVLSETVRKSSLNVSAITLQAASALAVGQEGNFSFTLTGASTVLGADSTTLSVLLGAADLNEIKFRTGMATSINNTYFSFGSDMLRDMAGNQVTPRMRSSALQAALVVGDATRPTLERFFFNANAGQIRLVFSEVMNASVARLGGLTIQNSATAPSAAYTLTGGALRTTLLLTEYVVDLSTSDTDALKALETIGTSVNTTFLAVQSSSFADNAGLQVVAIASPAMQATNFTQDLTAPQVTAFSLNMSSGILTVVFSETINMTSAALIGFVLQHAASVSDSNGFYRLTGGAATSISANTLAITLTVADLNAIKVRDVMCTTGSNTFLSVDAGTVLDMSGQGLGAKSGLQVSVFTADTIAPLLERFELNLSTGALTLTFNEIVRGATLQPSRIELRDGQPGSTLVALTGGSFSTGNGRLVTLNVSSDDLDALARDTVLAESAASTYMSLLSGLVRDMNNNSASGLAAGSAMLVSNFTADLVRPVLLNFTLNMNDGLIVLTFSEVMKAASGAIGQISLQNSDISPNVTIALNAPSYIAQTNARVVTINMSDSDLNAIKFQGSIAKGRFNAFVALTASAIKDMYQNQVVATVLMASIFMEDLRAAQLQYFDLNMSNETLTVVFSETMDAVSARPSYFGLQSKGVADGSEQVFMLGGGVVSGIDSTLLTIVLQPSDVNAIKALGLLARTRSTTFLLMQAGAIADKNGVAAVAISNTSALQVRNFTADAVVPRLIDYKVNVDTGALRLFFDETINRASLVLAKVTLQDRLTQPTRTITLSGSLASTPAVNQLVLQLTPTELNSVKRSTSLMRSMSSSFINLAPGAISDVFGNAIQNTTFGATDFQGDVTAPLLVSFTFTLDGGGMLTMLFNETMDLASLRVTGLTLQDSAGPTSVFVTLTNTTGTSLNANGTEVSVYLTKADADTIKSLALCSNITNCYLTMASNTVADMLGNAAPSIGQGSGVRTANFGQDTTRVTLEQFSTLDFNTGTLTLSFSEPVDPSTLRYDQITLSTERDIPANVISYYRLTNGTTLSGRGLIINIRLVQYDLSMLKKDNFLCKTRNLCFIQFTAAFVQDVAGNAIVPMLGGSNAADAMLVRTLVADVTAPVLQSFSLNIEARLLIMTFDEPIDFLSVKTSQTFTLVNAAVGATESYTLKDNALVTTAEKSEVINTTISASDILNIKAHFGLAKSLSTTLATIVTNLATDIATAKNINSASLGAVAANSYVADTTSPRFRTFSYANMNLGQLELEFDEPVNASTLRATQLTLQSTVSGGTSYTFTRDGAVSYSDVSLKTVLVFTMDSYDLERIKLLTSLAVLRTSTFLSISAGGVMDAARNPLVAVLSSSALQAARYETPAPARLDSFELNMNGNATLTLSFTGVMQASSLKVGEIRVQSKAIDDVATLSHTLTTSTSTSGNGFRISVVLSNADANALKAVVGLADSEANTFLSLSAEALKDVSNTPVIAVVKESAMQVKNGSFTPDTTPPALVSFSFTLDSGEFILTFSEVVDSSTLDASFFTVQDASPANRSIAITGSFGSPVPSSGANITVKFRLRPVDLNRVKQAGGLATAKNNTYLSVLAGFVRDMNNISSVGIPAVTALEASAFATDSTPPQLIFFSINMNGTAGLLLTFSETILASAVRPTFFTLQNSTSSPSVYTLVGGTATSVSETEISLTFSEADINAITALEGLARSAATSYLSVLAGGAADSSGNALVAIPTQSAIQAIAHTADTTLPTITGFGLNLDTNRLTLNFSETVRIADIQTSAMTLQSLIDNSTVSVALSGSQVAVSSVNGASVQIVLAKAVQDAIRLEPRLATSNGNTFLSVTNLAARDMFGNRVVPIVSSAALQSGAYTADTTAPALVSFAVSVNSATLTLNFNEPVNVTTFVITSITFKGRDVGSLTANQVLVLSGGLRQTLANGLQIVATLSVADLNAIKAKTELLDNANTTYISFNTSLVKDMYGNAVQAELAKAGTLDPDQTRPLLTGFGLDMDTRIMSLTFDETMNTSSLVPSRLVLQMSSSAGVIGQHRLTGGVVLTTVVSTVVRVNLTESDMDAIKAKSIALSVASTWLTMDANTIADMVGINPVALVDGLSARQVDALGYSPDVTVPTLTGFSLNMTGAAPALILTFSETIRTSSLVVSGITIQSVQNISQFTVPVYAAFLDVNGNRILLNYLYNYERYSLTASTVPFSAADSREVALHISETDFNKLALLRQLADSSNTTYLSLAASSGSDMFGRILVDVHQDAALAVNTFTADAYSPSVRSFSLDMDGAVASLSLTFSETVMASTLVPLQLRLQAASAQPASMLSLTGGNWTLVDGTVMVVNITEPDMNSIKVIRDLALARSSTFLVASSATIRDMAGNSLVPILASNALQAANYTADTTRPVLVSFAINMNSGALLLTFSETMSAADLAVSQLRLANTSSSSQTTLTLSAAGSSVANVDAPVLRVNLSVTDLNEIKRLRPLAASQASAFLSLPAACRKGHGRKHGCQHCGGQRACRVGLHARHDRARPGVLCAQHGHGPYDPGL